MARRYKKQMGGLLSSFFGGSGGFGGGQGMDFVSHIGDALEGFSNEPALSSVFSQSESLFEGFQSQMSDGQREQMGGNADKMKPIFDLFSLFSNGMFGNGFQDGGTVSAGMDKKQFSKVKKRFGKFQKDLIEGVAEAGAEANKLQMKMAFNAQQEQQPVNINQIIPGMREKPAAGRSTGQGGQMQSGGTAAQRQTINSQFDQLQQYMGSERYKERLANFRSPHETEITFRNRNAGLQGVKDRVSVVPTIPENPAAMGVFRNPSDANPHGTIEITPQGLNEDFLPAGTSLHEFTHASTRGHIGLNSGEDAALRSGLIPKEASPFEEESFEYLSQPTEIHARLNEIRKLAVDTGLHKEFGEDFTPEQIKMLTSNPDDIKETPKGVNLLKGNYSALWELTSILGDDNKKLKELLNTIASAEDRKEQGRGIKAQSGGNIPVSSRGQFQFPGQPVMVPTPDGSITMNGVNQDILALQNGGATILPANSGMHQFAPGNVLEIPLPPRKRKKSSRIVNSTPKKEKGGSTMAQRTSTRFNKRNKRTQQRNKRGNVGLPFGKKVGY